MARNLFILPALAFLAGCASPQLPPSSSGVEPIVVTPSGTAATGAGSAAAPVAPADVPAKKKLPLGPVRQK